MLFGLFRPGWSPPGEGVDQEENYLKSVRQVAKNDLPLKSTGRPLEIPKVIKNIFWRIPESCKIVTFSNTFGLVGRPPAKGVQKYYEIQYF